jgi:hypothetical protein
MGCFLEYLYTGDYFPRKVPGQRALEKDSSIPDVDLTGDQLLKHARVYTLAGKFGLSSLRSLASTKIHCVNSTAKGEIAYARYVYANTSKDDTAVRVPIANFWATRSHTLRAEAEEEFRDLCLEFPQFGYDVLSMFSFLGLFGPGRGSGNANGIFFQRACSTKSSVASATKRCNPVLHQEAPAKGHDTAAVRRERSQSQSQNRSREVVGRLARRVYLPAFILVLSRCAAWELRILGFVATKWMKILLFIISAILSIYTWWRETEGSVWASFGCVLTYPSHLKL